MRYERTKYGMNGRNVWKKPGMDGENVVRMEAIWHEWENAVRMDRMRYEWKE
ncbi:MAG: hypothetical protein K2L07_02495 [Lachnospiraceae bacterium]|nr:hypothetical protein [Lachnospiraceae bacterium]